jgi:hypothetical protein
MGSGLPCLEDGASSSSCSVPDWVFTAARSGAKGLRLGTNVVSPYCGTGVLLADDIDAVFFFFASFSEEFCLLPHLCPLNPSPVGLFPVVDLGFPRQLLPPNHSITLWFSDHIE